MKRRTVLLGIGTAAGGLALGTSAFTSVTADRDVEVSVVEDDDAFVSLNPLDNPGNGEYAEVDETTGEFFLDLTETDAGGSGLNPEAVTAAADVFEVRNQGNQDVELTLTPANTTASEEQISGSALYLDESDLAEAPDDTNQAVLLGILPKDEDSTEPITLPVGEAVTYGLTAIVSSDVDGSGTDVDDDELEVTAEVN